MVVCVGTTTGVSLLVACLIRLLATSASGYACGSRSRYLSAAGNCPWAVKMSAYSKYFLYRGSSFQSLVFDSSESRKLVTFLKTVTFSIKVCRPRACKENAEACSSSALLAVSPSRSSCSQMVTTFSSLEPAKKQKEAFFRASDDASCSSRRSPRASQRSGNSCSSAKVQRVAMTSFQFSRLALCTTSHRFLPTTDASSRK